jgi:hypothetical protein
MRMVWILLCLALFSVDCSAVQPLEYQATPPRARGFCHQIINYVRHVPYPQRIRRSPHWSDSHVALPLRGPVTKKLPPINAIFLRGGIDLRIIGAPSPNRIVINTPFPGLTVKVCDCALYLSYDKKVDCNQNPRPNLVIYMNQLRRLVVAGDCRITGDNLDAYCGLAISHCGSGFVCLRGLVNLARIESSGCATLNIPHVRSGHVHILASRRSNIHLGGSADLLLVRAFQQATVDSGFMCTNTAMVQAQGEAFVTVTAHANLRAFASENSNIYYYTKPCQLLTHNFLSGNVFYMGCCY